MIFENQASTEEEVRDGIIELYLNVKIRSTEDIANFSDDKMEEERDRLTKVDSLDILDYIRQTVEILMNMKGDEFEIFNQNKKHQERYQKKKEEEMQKNLIEKNQIIQVENKG